MDFYYQGILRWSYGFENPNKAAALIASLLPFCFLLLAQRRQAAKVFWRLMFSVVFLGGWFLLVKTYSRGGMVAAVVSQVFVLWGLRAVIREHWRGVMVSGLLLVAALAVMVTVSGLGARQVESVGDASVHNRFALWKGGLEMLADAPLGVGAGNSGKVYMEWYQPLTMTAGYRTMVNSFLTFATEQGVVVFGLCLGVLLGFWGMVYPQINADLRRLFLIRIAAVGSLLAFLAAGFFSTTMESPVLWAPPSAAVVLLAVAFWRGEKNWALTVRRALAGAVAALMVTAGIYGAGKVLQARDKAGRELVFRAGELTSARVWQKQPLTVRRVAVWVDGEVLGVEYGKALRQLLARGLASEVEVFDAADGDGTSAAVLVFCGARCRTVAVADGQRVVWVMPPSAAVAGLELDSPFTRRLGVVVASRTLERDTGGVLQKLNGEGRVLALDGADKNVLWYWDEILESGLFKHE